MPVSEFAERYKKFYVGKAIAACLATPPSMTEVASKGRSGQDEVLHPALWLSIRDALPPAAAESNMV